MHELERLICSGSYDDVLSATSCMGDKSLREARKWIAAQSKMPDAPYRSACRDENGSPWMRLLIACVATARDAKEALSVPPPDYRDDAVAKAALMQAAARHGRDWVAAYVTRASQHRYWRYEHAEILVALCAAYDLDLPADDDLPKMWCYTFRCLHQDDRYRYLTTLEGYTRELTRLSAAVQADGSLAVEATEVLVHSPVDAAEAMIFSLRWMLHALLARKDGILVLWGGFSEEYPPVEMPTLVDLLDRGLLDRLALIDDLMTALARVDSVTAQRVYAHCLSLVTKSDSALLLPHVNTLLGLLASAHGSVVKVVQELLRRIDDLAPLSADQFVVACEMIFSRKEKGVHQEQLVWCSQRWAAQPEHRPMIVQGLVAALDVDDFTFQKKVTATMEKWWNELPQTAQSPLAVLLEEKRHLLEPSLGAALAMLLGSDAGAPDRLPVSPPILAKPVETRRLDPFVRIPPNLAAFRELIAEFDGEHSVLVCEQIIDTLLQFSPAEQKAVASRVMHRFKPICYEHEPIEVLAHRRFDEIENAMLAGTPYPLVSRPDYSNGSIESLELIRRLGVLAERKLDAGPYDFLLALIRTRQPDDRQILALREIGSRQAAIAADFFAAGGMGQISTDWLVFRPDPDARYSRNAHWGASGKADVCVALKGMHTLPEIPGIDTWKWAKGYVPETAPEGGSYCMYPQYLTGMLPNNGELLAAWYLWGFRRASHDSDVTAGKAVAEALPHFLDARGVAGPALHLAILFTLSGNDAESRISGSDGLLELIAQDRYDSSLAVELVAAAIECGSVKPGRLAKSLMQIVDVTGITLWPLVRAASIAALQQTPTPAGSQELLALAFRLAASHGIRESIDVLARVAASKGSSKLLVEARRLQSILSP